MSRRILHTAICIMASLRQITQLIWKYGISLFRNSATNLVQSFRSTGINYHHVFILMNRVDDIRFAGEPVKDLHLIVTKSTVVSRRYNTNKFGGGWMIRLFMIALTRLKKKVTIWICRSGSIYLVIADQQVRNDLQVIM